MTDKLKEIDDAIEDTEYVRRFVKNLEGFHENDFLSQKSYETILTALKYMKDKLNEEMER